MSRRRVVVASTADDDPDGTLVKVARGRREDGQEVVYLGPGPSAEAIARVVLAEDAVEVVVPRADVAAVRQALVSLEVEDVDVAGS